VARGSCLGKGDLSGLVVLRLVGREDLVRVFLVLDSRR
jgi:hypothetical protein